MKFIPKSYCDDQNKIWKKKVDLIVTNKVSHKDKYNI